MVFEKEGADQDQDQDHDHDQDYDHDKGHDHSPAKERNNGNVNNKDHTKCGKKGETVDDMIVTLSPMEIRAFVLEVVYQ